MFLGKMKEKEKKNKAKSHNRKNMLLKLMGEESYVPMKEKELAVILQVRKKDREDLKKLLDELTCEGKVWVSKRGKYSLPKE